MTFFFSCVEWVVVLHTAGRTLSRRPVPCHTLSDYSSIRPFCIILLLFPNCPDSFLSDRVVHTHKGLRMISNSFSSARYHLVSFFFLLLYFPCCAVSAPFSTVLWRVQKLTGTRGDGSSQQQFPGVWSVLIDWENEPRMTRLDCCYFYYQ